MHLHVFHGNACFSIYGLVERCLPTSVWSVTSKICQLQYTALDTATETLFYLYFNSISLPVPEKQHNKGMQSYTESGNTKLEEGRQNDLEL